MIESIEKLRDLLKGCGCSDQCYSCGINYHGSIADEIEREVAEKYMLLPCDMCEVPIRPDDLMTSTALDTHSIDGKEYVFAVTYDAWVDKDGFTHIPAETRHVKPRTIEDVLTDFANEVARQGHQVGLTGHELTMRYAAEIRELMEVDA